MSDPNKSVFISYRRKPSRGDARAIEQFLRGKRYDVFLDVKDLSGGEYRSQLLEQIGKRTHFLILLAPESLERFAEPDDMMRAELEEALNCKRNIIPLTFEGFKFENAKPYLTGDLARLASLNAIFVHDQHFESAMTQLNNYIKEHNERLKKAETTLSPTVTAPPLSPHNPPKIEVLLPDEVLERAYVRLEKNDLTRAIEDFTEAIRLGKTTMEVYRDRGTAYMDLVQDEAALKDFNKALELEPENPDLYNLRGNLHYFGNNQELAMQDYNKALELNPKHAMAMNNRGNTYVKQNKYELAIEDYSNAIQYDPFYAPAYDNRGLTYADIGEHAKAIADWDRALRIDPTYYKARMNLANVFTAQGDVFSALEEYTEALKIAPPNAIPDIYFNRSSIYTRLNEIDRAITDYSLVIQMNPLDYEAHNLRGNLWQRKGDYKRAFGDLNEAISLKPDYAFAYIDRGLIRSMIGDQENAIKDYTEAIRLKPTDALPFNNRSYSHYQKGDYHEALQDAEAAIKLDPEFPNGYGCLAAAYFGLKDYPKALEAFEKKEYLVPNDEYATIGIAITLHAMGQKDEARRIWQSLIKLDPIYKDPANLPIFQIVGVLADEAKRLIASL